MIETQHPAASRAMMCLSQQDLTQAELETVQADQWENLQILTLGFNAGLKLFRPFAGLSFPLLSSLTLINNNIESIECLSTMNLPSLKTLELKHNKIVSLKPLRTINCPLLQEITIYSNPVKGTTRFLSELKLEALKNLRIQYFNNFVIEEDCRWAAKLETKQHDHYPNLSFIYITSGLRIKQNAAKSSIMSKKLK